MRVFEKSQRFTTVAGAKSKIRKAFLIGLAFASCLTGVPTVTVMLKIERVLGCDETRLLLSGELRSADIEVVRAEIEKILPRVVLDLAEIGVVDIDGARWLTACQAVGIGVENCAPYIREWILQEEL
jgi:hypothetical protein